MTAFRLITILLTAVLLGTAVTNSANGQTQNAETTPNSVPHGTVLRVNNDAITSAQIIRIIQEPLTERAQSLSEDDFVRTAQPLIQQATMTEMYALLVYQKALSEIQQIDNADAVIQQALDNVRRNILREHGGSEARAQAELAQQGTSIQEQLDIVEREMVINAYRDAHLGASLDFTRSQLLQYYRTHIEDYQQPAVLTFALVDIQVDHFLPSDNTTPDPQQQDQARQLALQSAQEALQQINQGTEFAEVARQYSNGFRAPLGGLWRPVDPAALTSQYQPIVQHLTNLAPGQHTDIITGTDRFFIAQLIEYQPAQVTPFAQAQFSIIETLKQQRWQRYSQDLSRELLTEATLGDIEQFIIDTALLAYHQLKL